MNSKQKEYIWTVSGKHDDDAWICLCDNKPIEDGFYPCDKQGREVEPTPEEWTGIYYFCLRCGRIINQFTLEIIGFREQSDKI